MRTVLLIGFLILSESVTSSQGVESVVDKIPPAFIIVLFVIFFLMDCITP